MTCRKNKVIKQERPKNEEKKKRILNSQESREISYNRMTIRPTAGLSTNQWKPQTNVCGIFQIPGALSLVQQNFPRCFAQMHQETPARMSNAGWI